MFWRAASSVLQVIFGKGIFTKKEVFWTEKIILYGQTTRYTLNDTNKDFRKWDMRANLEEPICEISPEDFPINEWQDKSDFQGWLQGMFGEVLGNGVFYLFTHCVVLQSIKRKKDGLRKGGRPRYSWSASRKEKFYGRPWKRRAGRWTCVGKFQVDGHEVVNVWERMERRKYPPYARPRYATIKQIEKNGNATQEELN